MTQKRLVYELSGDVNYIKIHGELIEIIVSKNENVIFHEYFLNMDISLTIPYQAFKF